VTILWLIAARAASESLRDRLTFLVSLLVAVVLPLGIVIVLAYFPPEPQAQESLQTVLTFYLVFIGMLPAMAGVGIAAGQFAGEKERGSLTPLLASPASNFSIFGGKVLGAILPPLMYACIGESLYLVGLTLAFGPRYVGLISLSVIIAVLLLIPTVTCLSASVASLVSSRVRTYNSAQQISGLLLFPVWGGMFSLVIKLQDWGPGWLYVAIVCLVLLDFVLITLSAATWRREEVLSQR
jgi:ABC-type Na+ efflux pump permease subunit